MRRLMLPVGLAAALMVLAGCGLGDLGGGGGKRVDVSLGEFAVNANASQLAAGKVTFNVKNDGKIKHEMVVLKTDLGSSIPIGSDNKAAEDAAGVEHVGEIDGLEPGQSKSVTLDLKSGTYLLICNIPDHFHSGMLAKLTVD